MSDNDLIVCYELPCHARTSRSCKKQPDDPFIIPVFLCDLTPSRTTFSRGPSLFGYPTIAVVDRDQAANFQSIYDAVVERLQRWTVNARDLYTWEVGSATSSADASLQDPPPSVNQDTEIKENGDVVLDPEIAVEAEKVSVQKDTAEKDVVDGIDEDILTQEQDTPMDLSPDEPPRRTGTKKGIFNLRLQANHKEYGTAFGGYGPGNHRFLSWEIRQDDVTQSALLRDSDAFFCEFDENMKAYYFGDELSRWEHALWNTWEQFIHPEYEAAKQASMERKNKGISLQDCLDEFTKVSPISEIAAQSLNAPHFRSHHVGGTAWRG